MTKQQKKGQLTILALALLILVPLFILLITSSPALDSLTAAPEITPSQWLEKHSHIDMGSWILAEPSSSAIVYLLALITLGIGINLLVTSRDSQARFWWGTGLLLWGIGTVFAGTSYQAFAYEIKAAGREVCAWTSWWEVTYLLFETASINALLVGVAYAVLQEKGQKIVKIYALIHTVIYAGLLIAGSLLPNAFLISFEFMLLVCFPGLLGAFIVSFRHYRRHHDLLNKRLTQVWLGLCTVTVVYFIALMSGIGALLWSRGIWFNSNDVLHVALIIWMLFIHKKAAPLLER